MKKIAMIENGMVSNIVLWDGVTEWQPQGFSFSDNSLVDVTAIACGIGYSYAQGVFSPPAE